MSNCRSKTRYNSATEIIGKGEGGAVPVTGSLSIEGATSSTTSFAEAHLSTSDFAAQGLLEKILKQLKIMNAHLAILSDIIIDQEEVQ